MTPLTNFTILSLWYDKMSYPVSLLDPSRLSVLPETRILWPLLEYRLTHQLRVRASEGEVAKFLPVISPSKLKEQSLELIVIDY